MSKTILTSTLSKNSFNHLAKKVELYRKRVEQGVSLGIEEATIKLYNLVIENCVKNNITLHHENIYYKYDKTINEGRVWTDDIVIIFNEFGTGIKGSQDEWANAMGYQVNLSGKGEEGWRFYNEEHDYGGLTHGIVSKHMFINALKEIEPQLAKTISVSISKTVGAMY